MKHGHHPGARKSLAFALVALLCAGMAGCGSTSAGRDESSGDWWRKNLRGHWQVLRRDATDFYRTTDRHVFNYDWEDPEID